MSLSILNNIPALQAENQLSTTNSALQKTLYRLASGSKLNSGADDAAGLSIANGLTANVAALTQSVSNASDGVGMLQTADGALSQVTALLNRAVTLATEASTSTVDPTQAQSLDTEYKSIKAEIDQIGQKTNFNNQNVFGAGSTAAASSGVFETKNALADPAALFGTGGDTIVITDTKTNQNVTFTTAKTAVAAAAIVDGNGTVTGADSLNNLASAINNYTSQANGAGSHLSVTASVSGGKLVLTDTSGSNAVYVATPGTTADIGGAVAENPTNQAVDQNVWTSTSGSAAVPLQGSTAFAAANYGDNMTIYDSATQKSITYTTAAANSTTAGSETAKDINGLMADINADTAAGNLNVTAAIDKTTGQLTITDNSGSNSIFITTAGATAGSGFTELGGSETAGSTAFSDKLAATVSTASVYLGDGTATTAANTISTNINSLSAVADLGLSEDLTSSTNAQAALTQITNAISNVAQQRGVIGASINRLNAATNVMNTQIENLTSAQSNISSADISTEVSNMTKYNVLTQTGISALSQSNQMQQALLKLLQ